MKPSVDNETAQEHNTPAVSSSDMERHAPASQRSKVQLKGKSYNEQVASLRPRDGGFEALGGGMQSSTASVQMKDGADATQNVHEVAAQGTQGSGGPLPHLDTIQSAFGRHDITGVQAHTGSAAQAASEAMGAQAYASGNDIAFGGTPSLHTAAHEAAHIVQQRAGVSLKSGVGETGDKYEQHADAVADLVVQGKSAESLLDTMAGSGKSEGVQRKAVQRDAASGNAANINNFESQNEGTKFGAEAWTAHNTPGNSQYGNNDAAKNAGHILRNLQKWRPTKQEGANRVASMDGSAIDDAMGEGAQNIATGPGYDITDGNLTMFETNTVLFDSTGPQVADVQQGGLGDCYLLAVLVSMANSGPGQAKLRSMVRGGGGGFSVDFHRMKMSNSGVLSVRPNSIMRVDVTGLTDGTGVQNRTTAWTPRDVSAEETAALKAQYAAEARALGTTINTVRIETQTKVIWPWVVEKAYAALAGSYSAMGDGGWAELPTLALMGVDSNVIRTDAGTTQMTDAQVGTAYGRLDTCIQQGGIATVSTRSTYGDMTGAITDEWRMSGANEHGFTIMRSDNNAVTSYYEWKNIAETFVPDIVYRQRDGSPGVIDPQSFDLNTHPAVLIDAVSAGRAVVMHHKSLLGAAGLSIVPGHAYTAISVNNDQLMVNNPWGSYQPGRAVSAAEFADYFDDLTLSHTTGANNQQNGGQ